MSIIEQLWAGRMSPTVKKKFEENEKVIEDIQERGVDGADRINNNEHGNRKN